MNCKSGDLAVVTSAAYYKENVGKLVLVVERYTGASVDGLRYGRGEWVVESLGTPLVTGSFGIASHRVRKTVSRDCALRPIRDPGDDAQDETLSWLPAPSTERETA